MKEVDLDNLTSKDLIDHKALCVAFMDYLMETLGYDEEEAKFVIATDFENPYNTPYIIQEYEGEATVGGREYSVRSCRTDFGACGLFHLADLPPFNFYMFFDLETLPDNTVGSYQKSRKLYLI